MAEVVPHKDPVVRRAYVRKRYAEIPRVKVAQAAASRKWFTSDLGKIARKKRNILNVKRKSHLKKRYGLTVEQHRTMCVSQNHLCACCNGPFAHKKCVDHNHTTGRVRGLVCYHCNIAISWAENPRSLERLALARKYLETYG